MAVEESQVHNAPVASETANNPDAGPQSEVPAGDSAVTGGPHDHVVHDHESEKKPTGDTKPTGQHSGAAAHDQELSTEDKPEQKAGEKREHDSTAAPTNTDKPAEEGTNAPDAKKQKTDNTAKVENGEPAPAPAAETNGETKKRGRPKKGGETTTKKKERAPATEGIGSRTRSRTKAT